MLIYNKFMDFITVLNKLVTWFDDNDVPNGLIGGFALGVHGVVRGTNDLDFLIDKRYKEQLKEFLTSLSYEISYESENVVQYINPLDAFGSLDFLYSFRTPSLNMLERSKKYSVLNGKLNVNVLIVEDIVGLKLQAACNDESRYGFDMQDIKDLLSLNGPECDWDLIKEHFELFDRLDLFNGLKEKYEKRTA